MKKLVFCLLIAAGLIIAGCQTTTDKYDDICPNFSRYGYTGTGSVYYLIDNNTGVVYVGYSNFGITALLNTDGTPVTKDQIGLK